MDYKKIYDDLISKARSENRIKNAGTYYEAHHIILNVWVVKVKPMEKTS
jgi:hypothetical protein